ncbi:MAG: CPBP family intramembrane glutamic endopeptidase [Candidatus Thermoplasmatota archaeon]|nr:CPBP family intramembrane glutamic endopeptidase [Candidatus Thermoplasmatota archaeon]
MVEPGTLVELGLLVILAWLPRLAWTRWGWLHALAAGGILYPGVTAIVSFVDVAPLIGEFTVLRPYSVAQLNELPVRILRRNLLIPLVVLGAVALLGGWAVAKGRLKGLAKGPATWRRELYLGLGLAPVFMLAQGLALLALQGPASFLQTGDESALFANATVWHMVALCVAPALAEEIYYRGLLQSLFEEIAPGRRAWAAIGLQGAVFAVAHAGFATLSHLLGPLLFGLSVGYLRSTVGLGAGMVIHAAVNLAYFSVDPGAGSTLLQGLSLVVALAGSVVLWRERDALLGLVRMGPQPEQPAGGPEKIS